LSQPVPLTLASPQVRPAQSQARQQAEASRPELQQRSERLSVLALAVLRLSAAASLAQSAERSESPASEQERQRAAPEQQQALRLERQQARALAVSPLEHRQARQQRQERQRADSPARH
jgi:hypothetical protein